MRHQYKMEGVHELGAEPVISVGGYCSSGLAVQPSAGLWPSEWTRQTSAKTLSVQ